MTRNDMDKLAALLGELYPRLPKLTPTALAAWYIVLQPYDYADVRENLIAWNRGPKGRNYPDARELIPERRQTERPPDRTYSSDDLLQAWRQNCWAWDHNGIVPDDWEPDDELLTRMAAYAPQQA